MEEVNDFDFATPDNGAEFNTTWFGQRGLTKREYFAALAMQGLCACSIAGGHKAFQNLAMESVMYADALIKELNK